MQIGSSSRPKRNHAIKNCGSSNFEWVAWAPAIPVETRMSVSARPSHLEFEIVASNDRVHEQDHGHDAHGQGTDEHPH